GEIGLDGAGAGEGCFDRAAVGVDVLDEVIFADGFEQAPKVKGGGNGCAGVNASVGGATVIGGAGQDVDRPQRQAGGLHLKRPDVRSSRLGSSRRCGSTQELIRRVNLAVVVGVEEEI